MANQRRFVEYRGERMILAEAIRRSGSMFDERMVNSRVARGWPLMRALTLPSAKPTKRFDDSRPLFRSDGDG